MPIAGYNQRTNYGACFIHRTPEAFTAKGYNGDLVKMAYERPVKGPETLGTRLGGFREQCQEPHDQEDQLLSGSTGGPGGSASPSTQPIDPSLLMNSDQHSRYPKIAIPPPAWIRLRDRIEVFLHPTSPASHNIPHHPSVYPGTAGDICSSAADMPYTQHPQDNKHHQPSLEEPAGDGFILESNQARQGPAESGYRWEINSPREFIVDAPGDEIGQSAPNTDYIPASTTLPEETGVPVVGAQTMSVAQRETRGVHRDRVSLNIGGLTVVIRSERQEALVVRE